MEKMLENTVKEENLASSIEDFAVSAYELFHSIDIGFKIAKKIFSTIPNDSILKCEEAIHRLRCNSSLCFDTTHCSKENKDVWVLTLCDDKEDKEISYIASESISKERHAFVLTQKVLIEQLFKVYDAICNDMKLIEELSGFEFTKEYHYIKDVFNSLIKEYIE